MKKRIIELLTALICVLALASCGQNIAEEAAQKGRDYFDSGDYETAAKAFGLALDNESSDEEVKLLYDITLGYYQANKEYEERNYETAGKILEGLDEKYENYGIKESILTLQNNINKAIESQTLLNGVPGQIAAKDYAGATSSIEKIDINVLSPEQADKLNEYKTNIASAQEEAQKQEQEQKAASQEKEKKNTNTGNKSSKPAAEPKKEPAKTTAPAVSQNVTPAINTNVAADAYIYPSDTTLLTNEQLKTLSREDLALIRNEIYARKGHVFTTDKYISYFSSKTWYKPLGAVAWADFNDIEKANIKLIKAYESGI